MLIDILVTNCTLVSETTGAVSSSPSYIAIDNGLIMEMGALDACPEFQPRHLVDGQGQLAMSGLVNGHCHAAMTLFRGMADDLALHQWLNDHIFPAEAAHVHHDMVYWCTKLAAAEMLLSGTTTVADGYFHEDGAAMAFAEAGIRAVPAQAIIDFPAPGVPDPADALAVARDFIEAWQGKNPLITPGIFAHAPYTCSAGTMIKAKELAATRGVPFFLHLAETKGEIDLISGPQGITPVQHLAALDVLDSETICVHSIWLTDQDIDILSSSNCSVITCPQSNMKLASGIAKLPQMMAQGIRIGIGTDGAASNNTLDLFREMDCCAKVQKIPSLDPVGVSAGQVLKAATDGGARALSLPENIGPLKPGNVADLILLDINQPHLQPLYSLDTLVYSGNGNDVRTVIINGQVVVQDREIRTFDLEQTKYRVLELASSIL